MYVMSISDFISNTKDADLLDPCGILYTFYIEVVGCL